MPEPSNIPTNLSGLEKILNTYLVDKAPFQIPANIREVIVKLAPWLTLVVLILLLPAFLAILALGALVGGAAASVGVLVGPLYYLSLVVLLAQVLVMALAIPGLFKRSKGSWKLLYYATLVSIVYMIVSWIGYPAAIGNLVSGALSSVISLYVLFQIRGYYR